MRRVFLIVAACAAVSSWAQSPTAVAPATVQAEPGSLAAIPAELIGEALIVHIAASIGQPSATPTWEAKEVKYTIPGSAVSVKLLGKDVAVLISITPYKTKDGHLLLVAQGQVWYKDVTGGVGYRTAINTLSVAFGERILFYPLGAATDGGAPLRVELSMDKYKVADGPTGVPATAPSGVGATQTKDKSTP
ncbi:MAG TPA: hypothetical protein VMX33_11590 [bacterium]|nr:hypothetical protein [bacterium]